MFWVSWTIVDSREITFLCQKVPSYTWDLFGNFFPSPKIYSLMFFKKQKGPISICCELSRNCGFEGRPILLEKLYLVYKRFFWGLSSIPPPPPRKNHFFLNTKGLIPFATSIWEIVDSKRVWFFLKKGVAYKRDFFRDLSLSPKHMRYWFQDSFWSPLMVFLLCF